MFDGQRQRQRLRLHLLTLVLWLAMGSSLQKQAVSSKSVRLVLVGGGHAHAQVIKALNHQARPSSLAVTLIDMQKSASYSGMVPGCIAGIYRPEQTLLKLEPLCKWASINFINEKVVDLDPEAKKVMLQNGEHVPFDCISLDIGSTSRGWRSTPGAREYSIPTRPISDLVRRIEETEVGSSPSPPAEVVVIGGGAAGIELALSIRGRWKKTKMNLRVTLLDAGKELMPNESDACRQALRDVLRERDIQVRHEALVKEITPTSVVLQSGDEITHTHCIWATGAGAHSVTNNFANRGLALTDRGWVRVNESLQSVSHQYIFAAGDCAQMESSSGGQFNPPPKAGVYAVRAGPILIENLTRFCLDVERSPDQPSSLVKYVPQSSFLKLIVCGDGTALGFRFGIPFQGKWVMELKDTIDQSFMDLFDAQHLPPLDKEDKKAGYDTSQYDAVNVGRLKPIPPEESARLLQQKDGVDFRQAQNILREMAADDSYRDQVIEEYHKIND